MWNRLLNNLQDGVTEPLTWFVTPEERVYWPVLFAALAVGVVWGTVRRKSLAAGLRQVFAPAIWLHPSSLMEIRLLVFNSVVKAFLWSVLVVSAYGLAVSVVRGLNGWFGPASSTTWATWQIVSLYTVVLFVAWDASRYLLHRLLHEIPLLWRFHQVHHSAEVLTPLTVYRAHPVESLLFALRSALVTGVVTGLFFYWFGAKAIQFELLGVNAFGFAFNAALSNLRHSHVWISFGNRVERWVLSPAQHQIHHSVARDDFDSNYGTCLAIWDRLGGSLRSSPSQPAAFGLADGDRNHNPGSVMSALVGPFRSTAKLARQKVE